MYMTMQMQHRDRLRVSIEKKNQLSAVVHGNVMPRVKIVVCQCGNHHGHIEK